MSTQNVSNQVSKFRNFQDIPLPLIIALGREMEVQFANELVLPLLSVELDDWKGKMLSDLLPDVFSDEVLRLVLESCFSKSESYCISKNRIAYMHAEQLRVSSFDIKCSPLFDDQHIVIGVKFFFLEGSQKVINEEAIESREAYLGNFFKHAPIGLVCYRGPEFIVDFANDKALEMWGKSLGEVQGKPIDQIFPAVITDPQISARHRESLIRLSKGQTHFVDEVELTFVRQGKPHTGWYSYTHEPYTNFAGDIVGVMAVAIEVTDQVLARKKLQLVTDALPSLVSYVNSNEQYELVNSAYETWFKHSRVDVVGKTVEEIIGEDAYARVKPHIDKALAGETDHFESWINYAGGQRRFVSASYIPHIDANNRVLGYIGLINDLTDRKNHEETLLENEARLRLIIEGIGAGTFEYDLSSGQIDWSDELKALLGLPKTLRIDSDVARSVVHPDDLPSVLQQSSELKAAGKDGYMAADYRIIRRDNGEVRWLHSRSKVLYTELNGHQVAARVIGFSIDITERKIAEQQLREFSENLEVKISERTTELSSANDLVHQRNEDLRKSESILQQLIDSSVELIAVVDRNLKFLAVNKAFESFVHKSRSELIGKEIFVAYEGARGSRQVELLERVFAGETIHLRVNPSIARANVWFDTHYVPLKNNGNVEGVIALSRDITDIIKSQQELADVNRQLQEAQHLSKLGSWEWDVSTGKVIWSDEMYRIYGYEEKFPVDFAKATERMSSEDAERSGRRTQEHIQTAIDNFKNGGELIYEIPPTEFQIHLPHGVHKSLRNTGKIQLTPEGKMHRILGVVQDVSAMRSVEERLRELIEELEAKNRELESFNYVASHDLKEPLRKIRTFISRIRSNGSIDSDNYLSKMEDAAKRMTDLIESILTLSQVSNSSIEFENVDLNKVLESCKSDLEIRIKETNAEIMSDKLPDVKANESQLTQVFSNLLSNSLKFCNTTPIIRLGCEQVSNRDVSRLHNTEKSPAYWRLTFSDNGIGFNPQYKKQIFEPFRRLHPREDYNGTGIGLSIVKRIIERHNGYIDVQSEIGKGTTFIIWLPALLAG